MEVKFYKLGEISDEKYKFAVVSAAYKGKWIIVRHKDRQTWEIPGGRREEDEDINVTAARELFEETGAVDYEIKPVCDYSVTIDGVTSYGRLFYAEVIEIGELPYSEIREVKFLKRMPENLTYAGIQPKLHSKILEYQKTGV